MTREENLRGMGMVVINTAFVLQMGWIPVILFLEGASWLTAATAVGIHRGTLAYVAAAPLAYGLRLRLNGGGSEALRHWLLRLQLPLTFVAGAIYALERVVPSVNLPVIGGLMIAGIAFGFYGVALRREGAAATA